MLEKKEFHLQNKGWVEEITSECLMNIIWHRNGLQINKSILSFIKCSLPYRGGEG